MGPSCVAFRVFCHGCGGHGACEQVQCIGQVWNSLVPKKKHKSYITRELNEATLETNQLAVFSEIITHYSENNTQSLIHHVGKIQGLLCYRSCHL
jgi:hypothetical protein